MNSRRVFVVATLSLLGAACGELPPPGPGEADPAVDGTAESTYADPETGVVYDMNPNRRVIIGPAAAAQPRELADGTTEVHSAVNAAGTDTDWSGEVHIEIVECISRGPVSGHISVGCTVSPDYVLVGGGAEDVASSGPGALLWESRPQDVNNTGAGRLWLASSKDHVTAASHTLHVWAVGLRLSNATGEFFPRESLKGTMSYSRATSARVQHPEVTCTVESPMSVIGGGARSNWQETGGGGQLLTRSVPTGPNGWHAAAKDHIVANPATLDAYCIATSLGSAGSRSLVIEQNQVGGFTTRGTGTFSDLVSGSSVPACYGGEAGWTGAGRMLTRMSPADGNIRRFAAASKDHILDTSGTTVAWVTRVRRPQ